MTIENLANLVLRLLASAILYNAAIETKFWLTWLLFFGNLFLFVAWALIVIRQESLKPRRKVYRK